MRKHDEEWVEGLIDSSRLPGENEGKLVALHRGDEIALRGVCGHCGHELDDTVLLEDESAKRGPLVRLIGAFVDTFVDRPIVSAERAAQAQARGEQEKSLAARSKAKDPTDRQRLLASKAATIEPATEGNPLGAGAIRTVISCNCESEHKGRPEGKLGCGRYAGLAVQPMNRPNGDPVVRLGTCEATAGDKRWDDVSTETPWTTLASARSLAEKWAATVGTLLTLLGIGSVLAAKDQLLKLDPTPKAWAGVLALLALSAAVIATASAARAAQGGLRRAREVTGEVVRRVHREGTETTANLLWLSRWSTMLSILFAAGALGLILYGDVKPTPASEAASITGSGATGDTETRNTGEAGE